MRPRVIYAPGVHLGGGLNLLAALAKEWPAEVFCRAFLDARAEGRLDIPDGWDVVWVKPSIWRRLRAEWDLARQSRRSASVLCFHNLAPLFACDCPVVSYVQNGNVVGLSELSSFNGRVRVRIAVERLIARTFRANVDHYVVQTPTMAFALKRMLTSGQKAGEPPISILPFVHASSQQSRPNPRNDGQVKWDFLYVSDGQAHKNHKRLFQAWILLKKCGISPSLAITLHPTYDRELREHLADLIARYRINVTDLGHVPHGQVLKYYREARAMIFASFSESFGIPLLEAKAAGLPIIAAELDFVRDVCEPVHTFDPYSPRSMARSVRRFMGNAAPPQKTLSPEEFVDAVFALSNRKAEPVSPSHRRRRESDL